MSTLSKVEIARTLNNLLDQLINDGSLSNKELEHVKQAIYKLSKLIYKTPKGN